MGEYWGGGGVRKRGYSLLEGERERMNDSSLGKVHSRGRGGFEEADWYSFPGKEAPYLSEFLNDSRETKTGCKGNE